MKTEKSYKDMTREERREAAQAKAQAALDRIGDGVRSVWSSEAWAQWLQTLAKFHDYSLNNTMLIAMQMPEATRVASYRSWQRDFGRHVKKGEHGIEVLVPMVVKSRLGDPEEAPRDDVEEAVERRRLVGFKVGRVFDVSQTEGEPLPIIAEHVSSEVERYDEVMDAICAVSAYPVEVVDGLPPETNGLFSRMGYIAIRSGMPQGQTVKTALHELAHSMLHDGDAEQLPDRSMREVQAESVAYAVSAALGLDTSGYSFGYVASWAVGKTDEEMRQCMQVVRDAAKDIIDKMDIVLAAWGRTCGRPLASRPFKGKGAENMAERQLTNDTCPVCGSTSIEGWEVTIEGDLAIQECTCGKCGVSWNDVYELRERVVLEELRL